MFDNLNPCANHIEPTKLHYNNIDKNNRQIQNVIRDIPLKNVGGKM